MILKWESRYNKGKIIGGGWGGVEKKGEERLDNG